MATSTDPEYFATLHRQRRDLLQMLRATKFTRLVPHIAHQQVIPAATYSPWNDDAEFQKIYAATQASTLVDIYRSHELWTLTQRTRAIAGDVVEIGVWRGGTAAILCAANKRVRSDEPVHLFDTFAGVVKSVGGRDTLYRGGEHADTSESMVLTLLAHLDLMNANIHAGIFPDTTGALLPKRIRLCHIDVDTYGSAKACMDFVWSRISVGGMLVFDDYGFWGCEGVTDLVNMESPIDSMLIHNLNGHGILIKIDCSSSID